MRPRMGLKRKNRSLCGNIAILAFLLLAGLFTALPLFYTVSNSLKPISELFIFPPRLLVSKPTLDNFKLLSFLSGDMLVPFERYVFNSLFVTLAGTALCVFVSCFAAYPLAKHQFPGKTLLLQLVVWAILFRPEVTAVPQFVVISKLRLVDTYPAVILPVVAGTFGIFLIRQFMLGIPDDIVEAARIDGLGEISLFFRIIMPMVKPAWITLVIFTFQSLWNTTGIQYIYTENMKMLPTALLQLSLTSLAMAGLTGAVAVVLMIPPIAIFIFCQSSVLETMAHSGIKS